MTALHTASAKGHTEIVMLLLNYHAQVEVKNKVGFGMKAVQCYM